LNISLLDDLLDVFTKLPSFARIAGHNVTAWHDHTDDVDVLAERLKDCEILVPHRDRTLIPAALIERLPKLKMISGRGRYPHLDVEACTRAGILVCSHINTPTDDSPAWSTAELAMTMILMSLRDLPAEIESMKAGNWQSGIGRGVRGRVLGIYAYGRIGGLVAGYARAMGMTVRMWGRGASLDKARADGYEVAASREEFFAGCDAISLHMPMIPETRGIVTEADLLMMKPDAVFVNTSRAALIAPGALLAALRAGRPGRAALDVFDKEPVTDIHDPLLTMPNVICTPHMGSVEISQLDISFTDVFEQIVAYLAGKPIYVINPDVLRQ
jgi:D-3-phosphoglycerate dehydrogenase